MRIAFVVHRFPELTQTFIINQIAGLIDREQNVTIFSQYEGETKAIHALVAEYDLVDRTVYSRPPHTYTQGIRTLAAATFSLLRNPTISTQTLLSQFDIDRHLPHRLSNLRTVLEQGDFDVYHTHFGKTGNAFLGVTECRDTPYVASFYGVDASQRLREDPNRYNQLFQCADAITVLSEDMRSDLVSAGCPQSKTHIQPLSIDVNRFKYHRMQHDPDEPIQLLSVARLVEKKGLEYVLRAIAQLSRTYDIRYTIAGDGERRARIESLITELELTEVVELLGWQSQSEIRDLMRRSQLFVLPSVTSESGDKEGTPTVLLEAQASGLPVVSTYHAGIPDIVADGESGLLVPERDVDSLVDALQTLIDNPKRREAMGKQGRARIVDRHSIEAATKRQIELYQSLQ